MNNIIKWFQLKRLQYEVNRYRLNKEPFVKLSFKSLRKRHTVKVLRIAMGCVPLAYLVASQKKSLNDVIHIDFMWVNKRYIKDLSEESSYYQVLFETFMRWHVSPYTVGISVNTINEQQNEKLERILTLFNFSFNFDVTIKTLNENGFKSPYREKEQIKSVVYTRTT